MGRGGRLIRLLVISAVVRRCRALDCQLNTEATSSSTGSITSVGGLGLAKKLHVGNDATIENNIKITGTADITGDTSITGAIAHTKDTQSTSKATGAIVTAGGIGVGKNIHVGGTADVTGNTKITGTVTVTGDLTGVNGAFSGTMDVTGNTKITGTVDVTGQFTAADGEFSTTLTKGGVNVQTTASDRRLKDNITAIGSALELVKSLNGVSFRFRTEEFPDKKLDGGPQIGFIAQDVKQVLPEVVSKFSDGYFGVQYGQITAVLVEAVKQQTREIELLKAALLAQQQETAEIRAALEKQKLLPPWD